MRFTEELHIPHNDGMNVSAIPLRDVISAVPVFARDSWTETFQICRFRRQTHL